MDIQRQREDLKRAIVEEQGSLCECCCEKIGLDLHEVFVRRGSVPISKQHLIFVRGNCALACIDCHRSVPGRIAPVDTAEFKDRFRRRLRVLGHVPFDEKGGGIEQLVVFTL